MAFAQQAPYVRPRRLSGASSTSGGAHSGADLGQPSARPPPQHHALEYAPMAMARDGSNLFSLPDSPRLSEVGDGASVPGRQSLVPPATDSDAELDLLALPPPASDSARDSFGSPGIRSIRNPFNGPDDAYSTTSEIFSPSGLSASERDTDPLHTDSEVVPVEMFPSTSTTGVGFSSIGTGTGGWARWAAAREAWAAAAAAAAAAARARRPSVMSLDTSTDSEERFPVRGRPRTQRHQRQGSIEDTARTADSGLDTSSSWASIPPSAVELTAARVSPSNSVTKASVHATNPGRGLAILDELDLFDDEIQSARRSNVSPSNNSSGHIALSRTASPFSPVSSRLAQVDDVLVGAATPRQSQFPPPSRASLRLPLRPAEHQALSGPQITGPQITEPMLWSELPGSFPTSDPLHVSTHLPTLDRSNSAQIRHAAASDAAPLPSESIQARVDEMLAVAPAAESDGLHKAHGRGMKRTRRPRNPQQSQGDHYQTDSLRVWSRLHGDYGRFNDGTKSTYSSDSELSAAGRGSKRSNASVSTTTTTRFNRTRPAGSTRTFPHVRRASERSASDWSTRSMAPRSSSHLREFTPRLVDSAISLGADTESTSYLPLGLANALWRKLFAVDEDVMNAFAAAEPIDTHTSSTSKTPLGISARPPRKFAFGDGDTDASGLLSSSTETGTSVPHQEKVGDVLPFAPANVPTTSLDPSQSQSVPQSIEPMVSRAVIDYMLPLPLVDELESMAKTVRDHRAQRVREGSRRICSNPGSLHTGNNGAPLEPTTGEALRALLGSVGTQLGTQVSRHFFFLSFARDWLARTAPWSSTSDPSPGLDPELSVSRPPLSPVDPCASSTGSSGTRSSRSGSQGSQSRCSYSGLFNSSRDTIARYQLGSDFVPSVRPKQVALV